MSRKNLRRSGGVTLEESSVAPQPGENLDSVCSQRQVSDVCEGIDPTGKLSAGGENISLEQRGGNEGGEPMNDEGNEQDAQLSSSSHASTVSAPKAIPTNEADMLCTTIENVSHVRFEWTVEDFYPQMYECGDMIQSEEFPPYDFQKEFWTLRLYPKGHQRLSKEQHHPPAGAGASSTDDDAATQFYLTLCPSHVASQQQSSSAAAANGAGAAGGSNNPNHIASSLMNTSSRQLQVFFRALINFSNPQGRVFHTETIHDCGGNITDELVIMKMSRALCEQLYKDSKDHLIISIELMSIDDVSKRSMKTSTSKVVDGQSRVISKVMKMKLRWKIEKFSTLVNESPNNSFIESSEFTFNKHRPGNSASVQSLPESKEVAEDDEQQLTNGANTEAKQQPTTPAPPQSDIPPHQWSLILYPSGKTERFKESLSVFLEHTFGPSVRVVIRFSLIDARGRRVNTKQLPSHVLAPGERWGVGDFIKHSTLLQAQAQLFPGNELRLYCQIKILERQSIDERKYVTRPLVALPRSITTPAKPTTTTTTSSISDDPATYWPTLFYTAYLEKKMCDMYLRCSNELHSAHKLVLGLRSSVLARMIKEKETTTATPAAISPPAKPTRGKRATASAATTNESMETETQDDGSSLLTIDINDIDRKTLVFFLEYVYTGGIKKLAMPGAVISHTLVIDLLTIAANYDMPDLKTYAEYYLKDIIRVDNACELLMLSDSMKSEMLKQTTCDYIANNLGNVMETTGWTELKAKQPDLIDTILKSCLLLRK